MESASEDENGNQNVKSDLQVTCRKKRKLFKYTPEREIMLLKIIVSAEVNPWSVKDGFKFIASTMEQISKFEPISVRNVTTQAEKMVENFKKDERKSAMKSGAEEEFDEKTKLLTSLIEIYDDGLLILAENTKSAAEKKEKEKEKEKDELKKCEEVRKRALEGIKKAESPAPKKEKKDPLMEIVNIFSTRFENENKREDAKIELEKRKLDLRERELKLEEMRLSASLRK